MATNFGLFGQPSYGGLIDEEARKLAQQQGLLALGANLMAAGGPSPQRVSFGQALGPALLAGQQAQQQGIDQAMQAMLLKTKLNQKERKRPTAVIGPNGQPIFVDEQDAIGKQPYFNAGAQAQPSALLQAYNKAVEQGYSGTIIDYQKQFPSYNPYRIENIEQVPTIVNPTLSQSTPLSTLGKETSAAAQMAGAEAGARAQATGTVEANLDLQKKSVELQNTYKLYEAARDGLISGLEGSATGPISGRIPAVTAAQQTAEGGVAAMAPVLKQLFRVSGEGVFTDRDQALLLDMVPKRTDHPEARKAKMENIDAIVKAKLSSGAPAAKKRYNPQTGKIE